MRVRVLHLPGTTDPFTVIRQIGMLVRRLGSRQFDMRVYVHPYVERQVGGLCRGQGVQVHCAPARSSRIALARHLVHLSRRFRPQVVHSWDESSRLWGLISAKAAGSQALVAARLALGERSRIRGFSPLERWFLHVMRLAIADSRAGRDALVRWGVPSERVEWIAPGVEPLDGPTDSNPGTPGLAGLNLPADARIITAVGPFRLARQAKDLIWAADLLKVIRHDTHLVLIGDGPYGWRLRRFRDLVEIQDRVHIAPWTTDVRSVLAHSLCFWESGDEGHVNPWLVEAMAVGVPVVVSATTHHRQVIQHERTGLLVARGDRAGFARQTFRLLEDGELRARLGQAARQWANEHCSAAAAARHYAVVYQQLAGAETASNHRDHGSKLNAPRRPVFPLRQNRYNKACTDKLRRFLRSV